MTRTTVESRPSRPVAPTAVAGVERMKLYALALSRVGGLINIGAALLANHGSHPVRGLAYGLVAVVAVESVALVALCWHRGRLSTGPLAADVVFSAFGLIANAVIGAQPFHSWLGFFMYPYTIVTTVLVGVAFRRLSLALGATALVVGAYLVAAIAINHDDVGNSIPNAVSYLATVPIAWLIARAFERSAVAQDTSRADAESRSAELARERERARHARLLHDRVLQTLEMLAHSDVLDADEIRHHVAADATWLRALVVGESTDPYDDLVSALRGVVVRQTEDGLRVKLNTATIGDLALPAEVIEAVSAAVSEALTNVRKHAGVRSATVHGMVERGGVSVCVVDHGIGFDPGARAGGFGLDASVRDRITEIGGRVSIDSDPGAGTSVLMWVPTADPH